MDPIAHGLFADATALLSINVALWLLSLRLRKTWPVDFIWSTWPLLMCARIIVREPERGNLSRQLVICALVALWGGRLTLNFVSRGGIGHEDWRYKAMRTKFGSQFWWVSLFSVFLGQGAFIFAACVSLYGALLSPLHRCESTDLLATLTCLTGILLEMFADWQMDAWKAAKRAHRTEVLIIDRGLWLWSRHPNYFGETTWWWGVWLLGARSGAPAWVLAGPCAITLLFHFISVPLLEGRQLRNKGAAFRAYQRRVRSTLLPIPPSLCRMLLPPTPQLALVGLDNSGKSTLAEVLCRRAPLMRQTFPSFHTEPLSGLLLGGRHWQGLVHGCPRPFAGSGLAISQRDVAELISRGLLESDWNSRGNMSNWDLPAEVAAADACIFIVDAKDSARVADSRALLEYIMRGRDGRVCACPVLVFCNKTDFTDDNIAHAQATKMVAGVCASADTALASLNLDSLPWKRVQVLAGSVVWQKATRACTIDAALGDGALHPKWMKYELCAEIERWVLEQVQL